VCVKNGVENKTIIVDVALAYMNDEISW